MDREEYPNVFFCYAHRDEELRRELDTHLALLRRLGVISTWYDGDLSPGEEWEPAILHRLETADVVLLLVSPDFAASDFCWSREMQRALERHESGEARVIPILLRPVEGWKDAPFGKLGVLPKDGRAATEWADLDVAFRDVAAGIREAVEEISRRPSAPEDENRLSVVLLVGHSLDDPLPEAAEMARTSALDLRDSGLGVDLRMDVATTVNLEREARRGCDLLIYYGHGTAEGELSFADGRKRFADLAGGALAKFWNRLGACFLFACYGDRFAADLPCPWVAFAAPILTRAPKGFVQALVSAWKEVDLAAAVPRARELCAERMSSDFTDVMRFSESALPPLEARPGVARLSRLSPALADRYRLDFASLRDEDHLYPDHDPFVGRRADLESLMSLPSRYDDRPPQRVVWVHGDAGMGKSALLRQFATQVRDLVFHEAEEPVFLLHLHCYRHTRREHVAEALRERARELYGLGETPGTLEDLFSALESRFGTRATHVWILDDLTYLSTQPDRSDEAARLVSELRDLARDRVSGWQLAVSSRRPGPKTVEEIRVGQLTTAEAQELAVRIWSMSRRQLSHEVVVGAAQLFRLIGSTSQFKRALMLAIERGVSYRAYADELGDEGSLEATEAFEAARRTAEFEVRQLGALEEKHGFAYGLFLGICYPLVARASYFTREELESWFGGRLAVGASPAGCRNGLTYLVRLNFLLIEKREGSEVFSLPPNQRWTMRALRDPAAELPPEVPLRGARERLSLALEQLSRGRLVAGAELFLMESEYKNDLGDPSAAAAVLYSMLYRSELSAGAGLDDQAISILNDIVKLYDRWHDAYPTDEVEAAEAVASALFNKGVRLGALGRSEESIGVYDEVVSRYGDRPEPGLAEQVASALFNKGFRLGALGRSEEEIGVYDEVVSRYGDRPEPGLAEQVAKALGNKGWRELTAGRFGDSVATSRAALERNSGALFVRCNLALALLHLGEQEEAGDLYAEVAQEAGTVEELDRLALADLDEALARNPELPGASEIRERLRERRRELLGDQAST